MIADIALVLSILNTILWVLFIISIRKLFKRMYPMLKSLTGMQDYGIMSIPQIPGEANSETKR